MILCQFNFKPSSYDDDFHLLDGQIDAYSRSQAGWNLETSIKWGTIPAGKTALKCGSGRGGPESTLSAEMGLA